ncbi:MAG: DUF1800 domain-containing protein [Pseudomonadales bacterium]|nr:DUF1800 domain-containing protein [Pseudomonadales bacterium]
MRSVDYNCMASGLPLLWLFSIVLLLQACGGGGGEKIVTPSTDPDIPVSEAELLEASRFAANATFGLNYSQIHSLAQMGTESWLDAEFAKPASSHQAIVGQLLGRQEAGEFDALENKDEIQFLFRRMAWWHQTVAGDDALRQRVAFALSQIFVVSDKVDALVINPIALSNYYDMLSENAFGNFQDLLMLVALNPAMGIYLSHVNNQKSDDMRNTFPDENFAREVMQLFSIGLFELANDGTRITDASGNPVATYTNVQIREFAKIFTGLSYGGGPDAFFGNPEPFFGEDMVMFDAFHEAGQKSLLNGVIVPAGQSGMQDIQLAIENLFNHPNVGPFIGKQLIQRLTTSNPSPAYVARVANAFNGDTSGVRGDMQAVIRAVLLDPEASADPDTSLSFGKLREPVVRYVSILRQLNANTSDGLLFNTGVVVQILSQQHPLSAPSVFNFFSPGHLPPGVLAEAGLVAPEFAITNATSIIGMTNLVDAGLVGDYLTDVEPPFERATLDLGEYMLLASDIPQLMDRLDLVLTYGTLSDQARSAIEDIIVDVDDENFRVRLAIYLILVSPDYAIQI